MYRRTTKHQIAVSLTADVQLTMRELAFLRTMAKHCDATHMVGAAACRRLDDLLRGMGVPDDVEGPVYDIFVDS